MRQHAFPHAQIACLFASGVATVASAPPDAAASAQLDRRERAVIKRLNRVRAGHGLGRLAGDRRLNRAAEHHSRDMLRGDFFGHRSSDGRDMAARVRSYRPSRTVGEVLAYQPGGHRHGQLRAVVQAWLQSPPHRATVLDPAFARIGVSRRVGRLRGRPVTVFTADLTSRR